MKAKSKSSNGPSNELNRKIQQRLQKAMTDEKEYLRKDLSMHQLAKEIETNTTYLSRIIKETYRTNFTSFLNALRIGEAVSILKNPDYENYTIDAISKECGYKNKSTFNKAFRNITGLTPNEYRKKVLK